jgi:hypothetical protein
MDILDQICSRIPTDWCDNPDEVKYFHPTLSEVESVTRAIIKRWTDSDALPVDDDTARKRADVCLTNNEGKPCVQYRRQPTCWSCGAIYAVIKNLLGVSRAGNLEKLHVCGICRCAIGTIAYCNIKVLAESTKRDSLTLYPDGCWKRKELEEYFNGKENTAG